jgi:phosphotriesterase-related protein
MSRRDLMTLVGAGAGAGVVSLLGRRADALVARIAAAPGTRPAQGSGATFFRPGAIIRTLLEDVPPESLAGGPVLFHEHLSINLSPDDTPHYTADIPLMVNEARGALDDGIACIVDGGHADMKRDLGALRRITTESGLPIVASGGYYMQRTYPPDIAKKDAEQIADDLAKDAIAERLGAFGEIGQQGGEMTPDERKVFRAIGLAHVRTGVPIFTHNAYTGKRQVPMPVPRETALRQLDILEGVGVRPENLAIGHMCCLDDPAADIGIRLAKRGVFVGFDRATLTAIMPDEERIVMIMAMVNAGYAGNVLIASDFYSEQSLKKNGGPGLGQAATRFGPMLIEAGLPEATLRQILVDNPRRFLAFVPRA